MEVKNKDFYAGPYFWECIIIEKAKTVTNLSNTAVFRFLQEK